MGDKIKGFFSSMLQQGVGFAAGMIGMSGFGGVIYATQNLIRQMAGLNIQFEQYGTTLKRFLGDEAKGMMDWLTEFARKTPYTLKDLVEASTYIAAFGMNIKEILPLAGDLAAAFGATGDNLQMVVFALGRLAAGQVGEALEHLRRFGISTKQLMEEGVKFSKSGQLEDSTEKVFQAVLNIIKKHYQGLMEVQAQTVAGMISNWQDFKDFMLKNIGQSLFEAIKKVMQELMKGTEGNVKDLADALGVLTQPLAKFVEIVGIAGVKTLEWARSHAEVIKELAKVSLILTASAAIGGLTEGIVRLIGSLRALTIALGGVRAAMVSLLSTAGAVATGIGAVMIGAVYLYDYLTQKKYEAVSAEAALTGPERIKRVLEPYATGKAKWVEPSELTAESKQIIEHAIGHALPKSTILKLYPYKLTPQDEEAIRTAYEKTIQQYNLLAKKAAEAAKAAKAKTPPVLPPVKVDAPKVEGADEAKKKAAKKTEQTYEEFWKEQEKRLKDVIVLGQKLGKDANEVWTDVVTLLTNAEIDSWEKYSRDIPAKFMPYLKLAEDESGMMVGKYIQEVGSLLGVQIPEEWRKAFDTKYWDKAKDELMEQITLAVMLHPSDIEGLAKDLQRALESAITEAAKKGIRIPSELLNIFRQFSEGDWRVALKQLLDFLGVEVKTLSGEFEESLEKTFQSYLEERAVVTARDSLQKIGYSLSDLFGTAEAQIVESFTLPPDVERIRQRAHFESLIEEAIDELIDDARKGADEAIKTHVKNLYTKVPFTIGLVPILSLVGAPGAAPLLMGLVPPPEVVEESESQQKGLFQRLAERFQDTSEEMEHAWGNLISRMISDLSDAVLKLLSQFKDLVVKGTGSFKEFAGSIKELFSMLGREILRAFIEQWVQRLVVRVLPYFEKLGMLLQAWASKIGALMGSQMLTGIVGGLTLVGTFLNKDLRKEFWGKGEWEKTVAGAGIGFLVGGPVGALIGGIFGGFFENPIYDRWAMMQGRDFGRHFISGISLAAKEARAPILPSGNVQVNVAKMEVSTPIDWNRFASAIVYHIRRSY